MIVLLIILKQTDFFKKVYFTLTRSYETRLIKEYDYKHVYKSYLHPSLLNFSDNKSFRKEDLLYLNNKKHDSKLGYMSFFTK